ncbi:ADM_collapsed_G0054520.mRNA.1.CDS.1 [Saccharomyces cerevisiae]|nr:ADM_collapsed_G0054520.mRNA.1.CDS.1 [Saccharomyces cerevisiae]
MKNRKFSNLLLLRSRRTARKQGKPAGEATAYAFFFRQSGKGADGQEEYPDEKENGAAADNSFSLLIGRGVVLFLFYCPTALKMHGPVPAHWFCDKNIEAIQSDGQIRLLRSGPFPWSHGTCIRGA